MFTGFASENTPAVQVWDFGTFPSPPTSTVSLVDDCAPIQVFKTGAQVAAIFVYLPSAPVEGKQLKIVNVMRGVNGTPIHLFASDRRGNGSATAIFIIGAGQSVDLCYSKDFITRGTGGATSETGWISLNFAPPSSANYSSVVLGGENNKVTSQYATVAGGTGNTSSGAYSAVIGGSNNIANASYAAVVGGSSNTASNLFSAVVGGSGNSASGQYSFVGGGAANTASATYSAVLGGSDHIVNGSLSSVVGGSYGNSRSITCNFVYPASNGPVAQLTGRQQLATLLLGRQTTNATATRLASDTSAAGTTNQVILPNNSAYYFKGSITAGVTGGGNSAMWSFEGGIKRGANAASTTLIQSVINAVAADAGASTWVVALSADTTNGGLAVTVTGQAATTIRWVCKVETTEMTF